MSSLQRPYSFTNWVTSSLSEGVKRDWKKSHQYSLGSFSEIYVLFGHIFVISEATKSQLEGDDSIKCSTDWFHKGLEAIKKKLPNSMPSQVNIRIVEIE